MVTIKVATLLDQKSSLEVIGIDSKFLYGVVCITKPVVIFLRLMSGNVNITFGNIESNIFENKILNENMTKVVENIPYL